MILKEIWEGARRSPFVFIPFTLFGFFGSQADFNQQTEQLVASFVLFIFVLVHVHASFDEFYRILMINQQTN
jgi:hypothetical protein